MLSATDMFCGAGGSTTGATLAGVEVKLAINHWKRAIETHNTNYPNTTHVLTDLHKANPDRFYGTDILIASPECTSHTLAKGKKRTGQGQLSLWKEEGPDLEKEAEERSRCTMWTPLDWAERWDYKAVVLENVVDAHLWRPFDAWLQAWKSLDYDFQIVYLNSMHVHPTPQSRDRMYFVAWKKKQRRPDLDIRPLAYCLKCTKDVNAVQCWKKATRKFGKYNQQYTYCCPTCATTVTPYYYAAANAIDWSLPALRIGDRKKALKPKTMQRIEYGLNKFSGNPFSIPMTREKARLRDVTRDPLPTQTATETQAMVVPFIINLNHSTIRPVDVEGQPFPTQTSYDSRGLVVPPFVMDHLAEYRPRDITGPMSTVCASGNHHSVVVPPALLISTSHGDCDHGSYVTDPTHTPLSTQTTRQDLALAVPPNTYLMTYYGKGQVLPIDQSVPTVTTLDRHAVVTTPGGIPAVEDCGFRMLAPHEIQAAMAFPKDYVLTGNNREKVKQLGNAVTPPVMQLLIQRVVDSLA